MDQLYRDIVTFQGKVKDSIDDPSHQSVGALLQEVQKLEDDAQTRKNPLSIEDRVKQVIRRLEDAGRQKAMSQDHVNTFIDQCEDFRRELQKLS